MSEIVRRPSRLDLSLGRGDDFVLHLTVATAAGPVEISGWALEAERAEVSVVDGPAGRIDVTLDTDRNGILSWGLVRTAPDHRRLLQGRLHVTESATNSPDPDAEYTLTLSDAGDISLALGETIDAAHRGSGTHVDDLTLIDGGTL